MRKPYKRRFQPAIYDRHGKRISRLVALGMLDPETRAVVENDARRHNCSVSWLIASLVATYYGFDIIHPQAPRKRRKR